MKDLKINAYPLINSGLTTANVIVLSSIIEKFGNEIRYMSYRAEFNLQMQQNSD